MNTAQTLERPYSATVQPLMMAATRERSSFVDRRTVIVPIRESDRSRSTILLTSFALVAALGIPGTSVIGSGATISVESPFSRTGSLSTSPDRERRQRSRATIPQILSEIRRASGATWDQIASRFSVSRRAVHLWASGQKLSSDNEAAVRAYHAAIVTDATRLTGSSRSEQGFAKSILHAVNAGAILEADHTPLDTPARTGRTYAKLVSRGSGQA